MRKKLFYLTLALFWLIGTSFIYKPNTKNAQLGNCCELDFSYSSIDGLSNIIIIPEYNICVYGNRIGNQKTQNNSTMSLDSTFLSNRFSICLSTNSKLCLFNTDNSQDADASFVFINPNSGHHA